MRRFDIRSAIVVACKYRTRGVIILSLALMADLGVCLFMQTQYEATAELLVKLGRELVYRPDVGSTSAALPTMDKDDLIASNIAIMKNPDIAREVIDTIGIKRLYPKLIDPGDKLAVVVWAEGLLAQAREALGMPEESVTAQALKKFDRKLSIDPVKKTDLVAVSFMHPDPDIAAQVANMVVALFQQKTGSIYANPNLDFMQQMVDQQRAALAEAEARLNDYRRQYGVYAFDNQIDMLLKQKMDIDTGLKSADAHIAELNGMVAALLVQRSATPQNIVLFAETERHKVIDDTQTQLLTLQLQEKQMAGRFTDNYQPLAAVRSQIKTAESALASERGDAGSHTRRGLNDTYQELNQETMRRQTELKSTLGRSEAMRAQIVDIDAQIALLSGRQRQLLDLQHEVDLRNDAVKTGNDKLIEARAVDGLNREKPASFSLVQAAISPELADPARPLPLLYTLAAVVAGLAGGGVVAFFSFSISGVFVTAEQAARRLNMPVLAVIAYDRSFRERGWRRNRETSGVNVGSAIRRSGGVATA